MRKLLTALVLATVVCAVAATTAVADPGPIQVAGQSAGTSQHAAASSSATQVDPSNTNISIRVLSPGNDGAVSQTNSAASSASAGNTASTTQSANQAATGTGGVQTSQQSAGTDQLAAALSAASQSGASNLNMPIRVLSPGNDGSVAQANTTGSRADAGNTAGTSQTGTQTQAGGSCGCSGTGAIQTADQSATTDQTSLAGSSADQVDPSNTAIAVRVLSPGDGGSVTQTNDVGSSAAAANSATTTQGETQGQSGSTCGCAGTSSLLQAPQTASATTPAVQQASQSADTTQQSGAGSQTTQVDPSNTASSVRVLSPGDDGAVTQSNTAGSSATAGNTAATTQQDSQAAGSGSGIQVAKQDAGTDQAALAGSATDQLGAANVASPVRVESPGSGGSVNQSNDAASSAVAGNSATTGQTGTQAEAGPSCTCGGTGIQVLGQQSGTEQSAGALSGAVQRFGGRSDCGCGGSGGNEASPVRVGSAGGDGSVTQSNDAASSATSGNTATTGQQGAQSEAGGGLQIQALGQEALTGQEADVGSLVEQLDPANESSPTRVESPGDGGAVTQANDAASSSTAGNDAATSQAARQAIAAPTCGCRDLPIQAAGQSAPTAQDALGLSAALQGGAQNGASPGRVWSGGGGGAVSQGNGGSSRGDAGNRSLANEGVSQG